MKQLLTVSFLLVVLGCSEPEPQSSSQVVPLPDLPDVIVLDAAQVINPRFPYLNPAELERALLETQRTMQEHFQLRVRFNMHPPETIETLFEQIPDSIKTDLEAQRVDFSDPLSDAEKRQLSLSLRGMFFDSRYDLKGLMTFAEPYLIKPLLEKTAQAFSDELINTLEARMLSWRDIQTSDGKPVLDGSRYNEWLWWDAAGYGHWPYDVVITNQLVASGEKGMMDVHSSLRGGVTVGTTSPSQDATYGSWSWVSSFPFLNNYPVLTDAGAGNYSSAEASTLLGAYLAHELGHQLLHLGHPFGNDACVMTPAQLLDFESWYERIDASRCEIGSQPQMQIGAVELTYDQRYLTP